MLEVQQLSVYYRGMQALSDISFNLAAGALIGLIGPNGAGKSTLIKAMLDLVPTAKGQVLFNGSPIKQQRQKVAYVPQRSLIDWDYPITVWSTVMMARTTHLGWFHAPTRQSQAIVEDALQRVEMFDLRHRRIGELSGGQQQRVFLARALAQQSSLLLFDEPLTGLDKKTEGLILEIYNQLKAEGKTLLISCHEWGNTLSNYDQLLLLNHHLIAQGKPSEVMTMENVRSAYGSLSERKQVHNHLEPIFFC